MSLRRPPMGLRIAAWLIASAASLAAGAAACTSPSEAGHVAVVPVFAAYVLLFRPEVIRRVRWYHAAYFAALTALVGGYLAAFARITPEIRVRWAELPLAVYFLASLHVVMWAMDRLMDAGLSAAFGLDRSARRPLKRYVPKTAIRAACMSAVGGAYLAATFMTHWVKFADNTDPLGKLKLPFEAVRFAAADGRAQLAGWFIPAAYPSDAAVVLAPGRGMPKACSLPHAQMLSDNGYNVLLFDLRGSGGSSGHTRSFGAAEAEDVLGACGYLRQARPRASRYIFGYGISHGAAAVVAAAGADERIRAVVTDSAFADGGGMLSELTGPLPEPVGACVRRATLLVASAQLGRNLFRAGAAERIGRIAPRPVLIIHGMADKVSPPAQADRLYASANAPKALLKVPGAGHAQAMLHARDEYVAQVLGLFKAVRDAGRMFSENSTAAGGRRVRRHALSDR